MVWAKWSILKYIVTLRVATALTLTVKRIPALTTMKIPQIPANRDQKALN